MIKKLLNKISKVDFTVLISFIALLAAFIIFNIVNDFNKHTFSLLALVIVMAAFYAKNTVIAALSKNPKRERHFMIVFKGTIARIVKDKKGEIVLIPKTKQPQKTFTQFEGSVYMTGEGHIGYKQLLKHIQSEMTDKDNIVEDILVMNLHEFAFKSDMKNWTGVEL